MATWEDAAASACAAFFRASLRLASEANEIISATATSPAMDSSLWCFTNWAHHAKAEAEAAKAAAEAEAAANAEATEETPAEA